MGEFIVTTTINRPTEAVEKFDPYSSECDLNSGICPLASGKPPPSKSQNIFVTKEAP